MTTQHTPGPWAVSPDHIFRNQADIFEIHWSTIGECIAECVHGEANARLIAAAPELLEALQHIRRCIPFGGFAQIHHDSSTCEQIDAAIAKATGATP